MSVDPSLLSFFAKYIEAELGIVYADHNYFQLQNRLEEIAKTLNLGGVENLYEQAKVGIAGSMKQLLLDLATNNETSFFRDPKIFKAMEETLLTPLLKTANLPEKIRIWSAASSSGQEALSTAIMVSEWNKTHSRTVDFSIFASDISERVLSRARTAQYSELEVHRGLSSPLLETYFAKGEMDRWTAKASLRDKIEFKKLNLKDSFSFEQKFDLILCRNVLIYQSVEGKIDILKRITASLCLGGFLILGSGESLLGLSDDYEQISCEGAVLYRLKASALRKSA